MSRIQYRFRWLIIVTRQVAYAQNREWRLLRQALIALPATSGRLSCSATWLVSHSCWRITQGTSSWLILSCSSQKRTLSAIESDAGVVIRLLSIGLDLFPALPCYSVGFRDSSRIIKNGRHPLSQPTSVQRWTDFLDRRGLSPTFFTRCYRHSPRAGKPEVYLGTKAPATPETWVSAGGFCFCEDWER